MSLPYTDAPTGYQWVETSDGSFTLKDLKRDETCHSHHGAIQETKIHYLEGCRIEEILKTKENPKILEVGLGLGLGFEMTLSLMNQVQKKCLYVALENSNSLIDFFKNKHQDYKLIESDKNKIIYQVRNVRLIILIGDGQETLPVWIKNNKIKFHAIYQDAFSPKKNPELWSDDWFKILANVCENNCYLSTYSSSKIVVENLSQNGFIVEKGPGFGPKRSSTRAVFKQ